MNEEVIEILNENDPEIEIMRNEVVYADIPEEVIQQMQQDIADLQSGKEDKSNKVTSLSSSSTDTQYPSAKCVYGIVGNIESVLTALDVRRWRSMSIADRITSMTQHTKEAYDKIASLGADLTGVNKNIDNIADVLDDVYAGYPKVTGSGTELSLSNCKKAGMEIEYKGNTSQVSTTGKNLLNLPNGTYSNNGITAVVENGKVTVNGTATATSFVAIPFSKEYDGSSITISANNSGIIGNTSSSGSYASLRIAGQTSTEAILGNQNAVRTFQLNGTFPDITIRTSSGLTYNNFVLYPQLEQGSTATEYEPYTGGIPSPNPNYPQDIHTVTGNNTVTVCGKNLWSSEWEQGQVNASGENQSATDRIRTKDYISVIPLQHYAIKRSIGTKFITVRGYDKNKNYIGDGSMSINLISGNTATNPMTNGDTTCVIEPKENIHYLRFNDTTNDLSTEYMMVKGDTVENYEAYSETNYLVNLGSIELCKLDTYQDKIRKSTGKNLFNKNNANVLIGGIVENQSKMESAPANRTLWIRCKPNTTYTIQKRNDGDTNRFAVASGNVEPSVTASLTQATRNNDASVMTITTASNDIYLYVQYYRTVETILTEQQLLDSIQIEENSSATEYEPYGKVWYKKAYIGKYTFDGSETIILQNNNNWSRLD